MQISSSLQNAFTPTPTAELSKTSPMISTDTTPQKIDSVNKSAYNYFDLGEDISQYTQTDPVQEKTNQELVTYLNGIMNDTTAEGKKNLKAFDTHLYGSILSVDNMTKEEFQKLEVNLMAEKYKTSSQQDSISIDRARTLTLDPTLVNDDYHRFTKDESYKLSLERFKNLYSFSDEFSKTDKFQELFDKYNVKLGEKKSEILQSLKPIYDAVGSKAYITSEVIKQGFSKSEAIDYYSNVSKELTDRLSWRGYDKTVVFQDMKDSIKLYDKITADLKDMWGYGDLNVRA